MATPLDDISDSPAFTFLEELLSAGKLTTVQVQLYRSKYSKLHDVVLKTYENEKNLLKKAKMLNQDLSGERVKLDKATAVAQEDSEAIAALKAEVAKGESELSMREERELLLQQELHDLQGVRNELQGEVTATKKKQMAELQPRIDEIEGSLAEVKQDNDKQRATLARLQAEQDEFKQKAIVLRNAKMETEGEKAQLTTLLAKVRGEPEKMKKQADIAKTAADSHDGQAQKSEDEIRSFDIALNDQVREMPPPHVLSKRLALPSRFPAPCSMSLAPVLMLPAPGCAAQMKRRKELEEQKMQLVMEAERHRIEMAARQAKASSPCLRPSSMSICPICAVVVPSYVSRSAPHVVSCVLLVSGRRH